jgi:hypothetical protein
MKPESITTPEHEDASKKWKEIHLPIRQITHHAFGVPDE